MKPLAWGAVLFAAALSTGAQADVIEAKNGQRLEGLITRENDKEIAINVDGVELTMSRGEISKVEKKALPKKEKRVAPPAEGGSASGGKAVPETPAPAAEPAVPAADTSAVGGNEFPILVFDERTWKIGNQGQSEQGPMAEFVLENETVENWSELVTVQMYPGLQTKTMPADFAYMARKELLKICPSVDWRLVSVSQSEATYEWSVSGCAAQPDQMEIVRVVRGELGVHLIHYAVKKPAIADEQRLKWIERLGRAKLVKK